MFQSMLYLPIEAAASCRYAGHCNCATDIKEAVFLGRDDELVACGSDDGHVFIYNAVRCRV